MFLLPIFLLVSISFIVVSSYFEHKELVEQEKKEYPAPGTLVEVNDDGKKLHVYAEGEGEKTLVFMSGLGTSSPVYDFKVLYDKLSDDYRIVVIERAGYGWSDITNSSRDIDNILKESRKALELSGEEPPYVLFPHSLSGLEAINWANHYPEEVNAIIGLDPVVPEYYQKTQEEPSFSKMVDILMRTGLVRNQPEVFDNNFLPVKKGHLTEEEAEISRSIFYRRVQTDNMWEEIELFPENVQKVSEAGKPNVPFHVFISGENENENWSKSLISYAESTNGDYFILDSGHYIHLDEPDFIAEKSRELIEKTNN